MVSPLTRDSYAGVPGTSNGNFLGDKVFTDDPVKVRPLGWVQHACVLLKRGRLDTGSHMHTTHHTESQVMMKAEIYRPSNT